MKKTVRERIAVAVAALGLAACDAASPPEAGVSKTAEPEQPEAAASQPAEPERPEAAASQGVGPAGAEVAPPLDPAASAAAEAIAEAVRDRDAYARARRLATLLPTLGPEGVPGVKETLHDPTLDRGAAEIELLVRFWSSHEPEDATRWAVEESPSGYRVSAINSSLPLWAAADPQAAYRAVREWENSQPSDVTAVLQIDLIRGWFERDPSEVARHIQQRQAGIARQRSIATYLRLMIQRQGPEAAMRWAESVPEDDALFKLNVYRQLGAALPPFDLDAALRWCEAHCEGPHGEDLRRIIAVRWVQLGGGVAALGWFAAAPDEDERDAGLPQLFGEWARLEPEEAMAWMVARTRAEDAEPWLPLLFRTYALLLIRDSPAEAIVWAERIENEQQRERMLIRVARAWRWQDEAAAEAWLRESPLSEEARERARRIPLRRDRPER